MLSKISFCEENRKPFGSEGIGSAALVIILIITLVTGAIAGMAINEWYDGNSNDLNAGNSAEIETKLRNLQGRVELLENILNESTGDWPVDDIYKRVAPSIVNITVEKTSSTIFGTTKETAQGSGFVFDSTGHILTNHHVVEGATSILVKFSDGETIEAALVGSDVYSDVAVLRVDRAEVEEFPDPLNLADSGKVEPGDRIIAIGNPFGLTGTTTTGIVSQVNRLLETESGYGIPGVIQMDAAINPGNSGGPLLSFNGSVIGITTAIRSSTGTFSGIGFAVPSNLVGKVATALMEEGEYKHPWIGITGTDVNYEIARERGLDRVRGFLIEQVISDSPAGEAGLKRGDVLLTIDDKTIISLEDVLSYIELNKTPGDIVDFGVLRDGEIITVELELGVRPPFEG